jgi:signal transduction histidine kinase
MGIAMSNEELRLQEVERLDRLKSERMRMILDTMTDTFYEVDAHWRYTDINRQARAQLARLGKDPGALIGKVLWDEFPAAWSENALRRAMREREATSDEYYYPPLGEWIKSRIYPSPDGGLVIFQRYVTGRKRAEEERRRSETYLGGAERLSHTGSWAFNLSTRDLFWSAEHFRIMGLDPGQSKPSYELALERVHPDDRSLVEDTFARAVAERGEYKLDVRVVRPDGEVRHIRSLAHPTFTESGAVLEYAGTIIDMTERVRDADERKNAEAALQRARSELAHVTRSTTVGELAAALAHEMNQPLAAIAMNADACVRWLVRDEPDIEQAVLAAQRIASDAIRAGEVIAHTRALLRKSTGGKAEIDMTAVVREVLTLVHPEVQRLGIVVHQSLAEGLPAVWGSRVLLQQVVLNLILNAFEAMTAAPDDDREIVVRSQRQEDDGNPGVLVAIEDAGSGFAPEDAERLFETFYTTKVQGLGMGLSISRTIIADHGGRLWAVARQPRGAVFQLALPVASARGD